ncbi:MAG: type III-B CRISPR module-associated protein Cmr5 [Verrucomicrobiales bacterium]
MQNLEQIRARNALAFAKKGSIAGDQGGEVIKKISPLIQNHGLLATAAYSFTEKEGWQKVFDAIADHLADPEIDIIHSSCKDRASLMEFLTRKETGSETLKLATSEAMAWLTYARRFVKKK